MARILVSQGGTMSKPIIVKVWKHKDEGALVEEEWTYDKIASLWDEDSLDLTPQLARRCQKYEEQLEKIAVAWACYKEFLQSKYPVKSTEAWQFTCPYHQTIEKLCKETNNG